MSAWSGLSVGRAVSVLGALVVLASGALVWERVEVGPDAGDARGVQVASGVSCLLAGALGLALVLAAKERRVRNGAAGAAFTVVAFVAGREWLLVRDAGVLAQLFGMRMTAGVGPLVAIAGALVALAGVAWDVLGPAPRAAAPALPDDERWR